MARLQPASTLLPRRTARVAPGVAGPSGLARSTIAVTIAALGCVAGGPALAQPTAESVRGADRYLNRSFGKVPLETIPQDVLRDFSEPPPGTTQVAPVPADVLREFGQPPARGPAVAAAPGPMATPTNIYGIPEGEVAIEGAAEMSTGTGPGVAFTVIQPSWMQRGDLSRIDLRVGPGDTHARLHYDVPSDFMGATWMSAVFNYSLQTPAYRVDDSPKYRTSQAAVTWQTPFSNQWIGDWHAYWGLRIENKGITIPTPGLAAFYAQNASSATFVVPNVGLTRIARASYHPLSEGKSETIHLESGAGGSGRRFFKTEYRRDQYWQIDNDVVVNLNGSLGYAKALGDGVFPLTQRFLASQGDGVRGYTSGTIGPTDPGGNAIGGLRKIFLSGETYVRTGTLLGEDLFLSGFVDGARLQGDDIGIGGNRNYVGYGLGITWRAPSGLVKFNFARAVNPRVGDHPQSFTFEFKAMLR